MKAPSRPIAFVLTATNHGTMIVNRNDQHVDASGQAGYGVGFQLLSNSAFDPSEVEFAQLLLDLRRRDHGDGVVVIDGGSNLGVHTIEWARHMHGWGQVHAFEAQEYVYYSLCGNIAINNCLNAHATLAALGRTSGTMRIPRPDYLKSGSFGSLELRQGNRTEFIGQKVSYSDKDLVTVAAVHLDALALPRLDFLKLDIEGMEVDALEGASDTIARCRPMIHVEVIKSDQAALRAFLDARNYTVIPLGMNWLAVNRDDPCAKSLQHNGNSLNITL